MTPIEYDWAGRYREATTSLADRVATARPMVAGFTCFVDALHDLDDGALARLYDADLRAASPAVRNALDSVRDRLASGRDGEILADDDSLEGVLAALVGPPARVQPGGTALQAAWAWATVGAPAMVSVTDRSTAQRAVVPAGVTIAEPPIGTGDVAPSRRNHILQFTAGARFGPATLDRSSRISLRGQPKRLQLDDGFAHASTALLERGGVAVVSGLLGLREHDRARLGAVADLALQWRRRDAHVHLELSQITERREAVELLALLAPAVDTVGLAWSELEDLTGPTAATDPARAARDLADAAGLPAVCVHADAWAMSVHRRDPRAERDALLLGCAAAAARAGAGLPQADWAVADGATFGETPGSDAGPGWTATAVAVPHMRRPRSTIGLGDTFVAGSLLARAGRPCPTPTAADGAGTHVTATKNREDGSPNARI